MAFDGKLDETIKNIRCGAYYSQAVELSKSKNIVELSRANDYFNVAKRMCPAMKNIDSLISKNNKQIKKATRK